MVSTRPAVTDNGERPSPDPDAFRRALRQVFDDSGHTVGWLAVEVAKAEGRKDPYSQPHASDWLSGRRQPNPQQVFAMERAFGTEPGALSRMLGYLPVDAVPAVTVAEAVAIDPTLSVLHRKAVMALYDAVSDPGEEG